MGGRYFEAGKRKSREGIKILEGAVKEGETAEKDARRIEAEFEAAKDLNLDDDIRREIDIARKYTRNRFERFMNGIENEIEKGKNILSEANEISEHQIDSNTQVLDHFKQMDNIRDFGKEAREKGRSEIEKSSSAFKEIEKTNERAASEADSRYLRAMSNIEKYFS